MNKKDDPQVKKALGLHPGTGPNTCQGCTYPKILCKCPKSGGGSGPSSSSDSSDNEKTSGAVASTPSQDTLTVADASSTSKTSAVLQGAFVPVKASSALRAEPTTSLIEQLLKRAKSMGIDALKLLKSQGIDIEQKANMEELHQLAQKGNPIAHKLYLMASENVLNRSKLARSHLESVKNPFQLKNRKD